MPGFKPNTCSHKQPSQSVTLFKQLPDQYYFGTNCWITPTNVAMWEQLNELCKMFHHKSDKLMLYTRNEESSSQNRAKESILKLTFCQRRRQKWHRGIAQPQR
jgi:hypothetical protein